MSIIRWSIRLSNRCYLWNGDVCLIVRFQRDLLYSFYSNRIITRWWTIQSRTYVTSVSKLMTITTLGSRSSKKTSSLPILHRLIYSFVHDLRCQNRGVNGE
uniref:Putative ovule protein n=1 Tax=Solanum chacoense TaxID=4108 RepID=A0A0V0GQP0_SOLCH